METVNSIEVSEDQHIADPDGWEHEVEYRWEDMDGAVVYGFMEGWYECFRFIPEWALAEDWVVEDFEEPFSFPDWCGSDMRIRIHGTRCPSPRRRLDVRNRVQR